MKNLESDSPLSLSARDKFVFAGLYLSKFDEAGLKELGFSSFTEAFNVLGYALGGKPAVIKNYRDEFDPLFPNGRRGWHKRPRRGYCMRVFDSFPSLNLEEFSNVLKAILGVRQRWNSQETETEDANFDSPSFACRTATGIAAENYFRENQPRLPEFEKYRLEDTTLLGCGFDFRLRQAEEAEFLAIEVKGLQGVGGSLSMTSKEHDAASVLGQRFFLFVVQNFRETPFHSIYGAPLQGPLAFTRTERTVVRVTFSASV